MATLLCGSGRSLRVRGGVWLQRVEAFVLALLLAGVLSVPTVRAQTLNSNGSLNWGITTSGPSTSTVNGTALVITAAALSIGLVATGGVPATMVATGRAFTLAGQYVGPIAAAMLRQAASKGALTGSMLALAAALGGDAAYDAASNTFLSPNADAGDPSNGAKYWYMSYSGSKCWGSQSGLCGWQEAHDALWSSYAVANPGVVFIGWENLVVFGTGQQANHTLRFKCGASQCTATFSFTSYGTRPVGTAPSSDAQLSSAAAAPSALAKVWDAGGCGAKVKMYRDTLSADDPCAQIVNHPQGTWSPVSLPNGGYIAFPGKTDTVTDSTGKVTQTVTTTPTAQVNANTNQATMAASPVSVTPGSVVKTVTNNADGTQTTTTTTSTNPSSTSEQPQDGTAAFNAGTQDLYTKKTRTWDSVLADYQNTVKAAPWFQATTGFFNVSISGASCPRWSVPATKWIGALDTSPYICGSAAITLYQMGGAVVMIVAAWAAFRIAFL